MGSAAFPRACGMSHLIQWGQCSPGLMLRAAVLGIARGMEELSIPCDAASCTWGRANWTRGGRMRPPTIPAHPLLEHEAIPAAGQAERSPRRPLSPVLGELRSSHPAKAVHQPALGPGAPCQPCAGPQLQEGCLHPGTDMPCPTPVTCQFSITYPHYISSLFRSAPLQLYESLRSSNSNQPLDYRWVFTSCLRGVTSPEWDAGCCSLRGGMCTGLLLPCRWPLSYNQWWECEFITEGIIDNGERSPLPPWGSPLGFLVLGGSLVHRSLWQGAHAVPAALWEAAPL